MKGSCIIDGIDIHEYFGAFILRGGDYDLISFPDRIEPDTNNWFEYDGIDADLTEIYFKEKSVTVKFYLSAETGNDFLFRINGFYELLSKTGYREMYSREFDKTFKLRFVSCSQYKHKGGLIKTGVKRGEISVLFSMDDPLQLFTGSNLVPASMGEMLATENDFFTTTEDGIFLLEIIEKAKQRNETHVSLNGYDLSEFGIIVSQTYDTVLQLPAVKAPLIQRNSKQNGLKVYFPSKSTYQSKQIVIDCYMIAESREEFYHNYEALFNNLRITEALQITTPAGEAEYYYSQMTGFEKRRPFSVRPFVKFSLVLTGLSSGLVSTILQTENDFALITEDDKNLIAI